MKTVHDLMMTGFNLVIRECSDSIPVMVDGKPIKDIYFKRDPNLVLEIITEQILNNVKTFK